MAESSVSKSSVSSVSQRVQNFDSLAQAKGGFLDRIFPLLDQMMEKTRFPSWFVSFVSIFILLQNLSVGAWIYTPNFQRTSGHWTKLYKIVIYVLTFSNPLDTSKISYVMLGLCIGIAVFSVLWIFFMDFYNKKFYMLPVPLLYVSSLIIDIIDPIFIIPSVYVANHGITGLLYRFEYGFIAEIIAGGIAYGLFLLIFLINTFLKCRSVVLTNLVFPMFDYFSVTIWIIITSFFSMLTAIFNYFDEWYYSVVGAIHILITLYIIYRLLFIPFYEVWRNSIALAFGITAILLDINFYVLTACPSLTYNYTIFVFVLGLLIGYAISYLYYTKKVARVKKELSYQDEIPDKQEYMETLSIKKGIHYAMMYIVVGLYGICDYFIDGSVSNFILNQPQLEAAVAIMLQIITFFPSESKKMDLLFKRVLTKRKLNLAERFLIYQCYRIKVRRLVSDTKDTLETFNKLKLKNDTVKSIIKSFWDKQDADNSFLSNLSITVSDVDSLFKACLASNPNNLRMTNLYADFLAECKCDFDSAIVESIKADMIADGRNFNVDISFRSVVNKFPRYLKDRVLDFKGRRVLKGNMKQNGSESKNSSSSSRNDSFDSKSVDFERQELVSKKILRDAKVRLAFHHAIVDTKPWQYNTIAMLTLWDISLIILFFIGFYGYVSSNLKWRRSSYRDLSNAGYATFYSVYANVYTLSKFASDNGRYNQSNAILGNISIDDSTVVTLVPVDITMGMKTFFCLNKSNMYLRALLQSLADQAMADDDPYEIAPILLSENSTFSVCNEATPKLSIKSSLKALVLVINYHSNYLAGIENVRVIPNIFQENDYCQIMTNIPTIATNADDTFSSILNYNINKASAYKPKFMGWMVIGSLMIFFGIALPAVIIINTYNSMVDKIIKVLLALPNHVKDDAKRPLMINSSDDNNEPMTSKVETSNIMDILPRIFFLVLFGIVGTYIAFCLTTIRVNNKLTLILQWFYYSCARITMASQLGNNALQLIFLNGSLNQSIMDRDELVKFEEAGLQKLKDAESILLNGNGKIKGSIGYDSQLDEFNIEPHCTLGRDPKTIHDMYACGSIDTQINIFRQMVEEVIKNPDHFHGAMNNEVAANMAHILRFHFYPSVIRATARIAEIMENTYDKSMKFDIVFLVIGLVCMLIIFTLPWFFRDFVIQNYRMLMMALQHLPPQTIVDTPEILEIFSRRKKSSKAEKMPISKSIVYGASECIIITNSSSVIEIVNQSVTENIGLTPDQMLGQHIANFVSDNEQQRLNQQIDLMVSGQGSSFWQDHLQLTNDNNELIPFSVTMIGMKDNEESSDIKSFVYILTNETDEIEKRKAAEEAKAKSEKLLYQILPKDIVIRLNRGETDISFSIPSATIFFIDIVKFSAYTANLTPSEIMSNLSLVFATFDGIVSEYPSITKIKLIGDVYMAAAGLFQTEEDKFNHAEDAVRCCLRVQKSMEEINMKLNASLEVRIGVNSGGPLIGGVLGTDKPTFDIIGDTINVAARLQSTDIPGNVQISGDTKAMIENLDFEIEERGEIYLKGKGNRLTYFVNFPKQNDLEQSFTATITGRKDLM